MVNFPSSAVPSSQLSCNQDILSPQLEQLSIVNDTDYSCLDRAKMNCILAKIFNKNINEGIKISNTITNYLGYGSFDLAIARFENYKD